MLMPVSKLVMTFAHGRFDCTSLEVILRCATGEHRDELGEKYHQQGPLARQRNPEGWELFQA